MRSPDIIIIIIVIIITVQNPIGRGIKYITKYERIRAG